MYVGNNWIVNGQDRGVICRLTIYARRNDKASQPSNISVRKITWLEGIQESSRLAMLRICNIYRRELKDTVFRYHPRAAAVDLPACYPSTEEESNATVVHLAQYTAAQEESMERMATELEDVYETLRRAEERIVILQETIHASMSRRRIKKKKIRKNLRNQRRIPKKIQKKTQLSRRKPQSQRSQPSQLHQGRLFLLHQSQGIIISSQGCQLTSESTAGRSAAVAVEVFSSSSSKFQFSQA